MTTTTRRVFIAPVAEPLNGAWHDLHDYADREALDTAARAQIAKTPANAYAEELDCPDVEGFGNLFAGQYYVSTSDVWTAHEWLTACEAEGISEDVATAYANTTGERMPDPSDIADAYLGEYDSVEAYADEYITDSGLLDNVSDTVRQYFDYDAFARDLVLGGDVWTTDRHAGTVHIFRN